MTTEEMYKDTLEDFETFEEDKENCLSTTNINIEGCDSPEKYAPVRRQTKRGRKGARKSKSRSNSSKANKRAKSGKMLRN
jgi:hypothetical protein